MSKLLVGIVMGSKSDMPVMQKAVEVLKEFGIESELKILSAHRTPKQSEEFSKTARDRGLSVIIAGAGGAAHLAGAMAAQTTLPVIGVPIKASFAIAEGLDALLSTVQMPSGVPVATVAVDGAKNAGVLAAQIIGTFDKEVEGKLKEYKKTMEKNVLEANN